MEFDHEGEELWIAGAYGLEVWDRDGTERIRSLFGTLTSWNLALSQAGHAFATDGANLRVWELSNERDHLRLPGLQGRAIATFDAEGRRIFTGDASGRVQVWDATSGSLEREWTRVPGPVRALRPSADGAILAVGGGQELVLLDAETGALLQRFDGFVDQPNNVDFHPNGDALVFARDWSTFEVRSLVTGELWSTLQGDPGSESLSVRYTPDGERIVTLNRDYMARVWSSAGELVAATSHPFTWWQGAPSVDGRKIAFASFGRTLEIWNAQPFQWEQSLKGYAGIPWSLDWHPLDDRLLATASADGTVQLWNTATGRALVTLDCFDSAEATRVQFGPEGRRLLVSGHRGQVMLWDLEYYRRHIAGNLVHQLQGFQSELGSRIDSPGIEDWRRTTAAHQQASALGR